jgi:cytochrome c oxidase cbb3-type subunit 3
MNQESRNAGKKSGWKSFLLSCFPDSLVFVLLCSALSISSCKREERGFRVAPPAADKIQSTSVSDLHPAGAATPIPVKNDYEENAYATSEGQRLFTAFNCVGCHAHGGGGMGPALMDNKWAYGSQPPQIFATIIEGRPNGMPSFRGKIPDYQVWQLAAYVRSLGGLGTSGASPPRSDEMKGPLPPNSMPAQTPQNSSLPKPAEMPPS